VWDNLNIHLRKANIVDPACGSGSFLVGMLHILDDLQERAGHQLNINEPTYERRKRIIGQSLYGVDVMDWACHVAELRLWLALIIDVDRTIAELHTSEKPLLPNFTFNIRCGDSLVQEIGGINMGRMHGYRNVPPSLKSRITTLKTEKLKFYANDSERRFRSLEQIRYEEKRLFRDILHDRKQKISKEIEILKQRIDGVEPRQIKLDGTVEEKPYQMELDVIDAKERMELLTVQTKEIEDT